MERTLSLNSHIVKGKGITVIQRHKPHTATEVVLCVTDRAGVQTRLQSKPTPRNFDLQSYSHT